MLHLDQHGDPKSTSLKLSFLLFFIANESSEEEELKTLFQDTEGTEQSLTEINGILSINFKGLWIRSQMNFCL